MVFVAVAIEAFDLIYIQRPLNYAIELKADKKDILRIKSAFTSKANELNVLTYDNAVWDETYKFIDKENPLFPERIFDKDAFTSLNIHGIHLYSNNFPHVWGKSYNQDFSKLLPFPAFDQPGTFIKNNLLITPKMVSDNNGKPFSHSGYINIENQLIIFSATSIFHSNAQGNSNGTMVYWRYLDDNGIVDLQKRAGIKFTLSTKSKSFPQNSLNTTSLRTVKNDINTAIPLFGNSGSIGISYQAPTRLFDVNWLNRSTVMTLSSFFLILLTLTLLTHVIVIRPILNAGEKIKKIVQSNNRISRFNTKRTDELGSLFSLIDLLLASIASQEQELISHNVKLQQISETDDLTKIANRRAFDLYMTKLFTIEEKGLPVSILVCDIDYFKNYNDCYGHSNGDNALRLVAMSLQRNLHQETDFLARYGG
jgi:sensor domain CHASE-containing protein